MLRFTMMFFVGITLSRKRKEKKKKKIEFFGRGRELFIYGILFTLLKLKKD